MKSFSIPQQRKLFKEYKEKAEDLLGVRINLYEMHSFSWNREKLIKDYEEDLLKFINTYIEEKLRNELLSKNNLK